MTKTPITKTSTKSMPKKAWSVSLMILLTTIFVIGSYGTYMFAVSPHQIRKPTMQHYHFRMQVLVDGKAENFGANRYQQDYAKDQCNVNLAEQPIHFHDNKDQFVHIHWDGMTGGMVLKYYGWNYTGGMDNALGYKLDNLADIQKVTTHGSMLPAVPKGSSMYVYVGDTHGYQAKKFDDFIKQDLERFFDKRSSFQEDMQTSFLDRLFPKAFAHTSHDHEEEWDTSPAEAKQERLARINNVLGNVVIFVQQDAPSKGQIAERFNHLEPISDSACAG